MQSSSPIGDTWYAQVRPPWVTNSLDVTYTAGGIAWAIGELPTFVLLIVVAVQWSRDDSRKAAQQDRAADRDNDLELKEYNERLNRLNSGPE
jgi:putative copper resistance protein D